MSCSAGEAWWWSVVRHSEVSSPRQLWCAPFFFFFFNYYYFLFFKLFSLFSKEYFSFLWHVFTRLEADALCLLWDWAGYNGDITSKPCFTGTLHPKFACFGWSRRPCSHWLWLHAKPVGERGEFTEVCVCVCVCVCVYYGEGGLAVYLRAVDPWTTHHMPPRLHGNMCRAVVMWGICLLFFFYLCPPGLYMGAFPRRWEASVEPNIAELNAVSCNLISPHPGLTFLWVQWIF